MGLSLSESQTLNELAGLLYDFLPGSGNSNFSFPIAARTVGVGELWLPGSKRPAILRLLEGTLAARRHRFCDLILAVVRLSMGWRSGKDNPLTLAEIDQLNGLLLRLEIKIPELRDPGFRGGLARPASPPKAVKGRDPNQLDTLNRELIALEQLEPAPRGYAFERFLRDMFDLFEMAPRTPFSLRGEQIDGSFHFEGATYLLEAKWQNQPIGNRELQSFYGSVRSKAIWSRGLFVSYSGFTDDGLEAFSRGTEVRVICMAGEELWQVLRHRLDLAEVLALKVRRAGETGRAFTHVRDLYPGRL